MLGLLGSIPILSPNTETPPSSGILRGARGQMALGAGDTKEWPYWVQMLLQPALAVPQCPVERGCAEQKCALLTTLTAGEDRKGGLAPPAVGGTGHLLPASQEVVQSCGSRQGAIVPLTFGGTDHPLQSCKAAHREWPGTTSRWPPSSLLHC